MSRRARVATLAAALALVGLGTEGGGGVGRRRAGGRTGKRRSRGMRIASLRPWCAVERERRARQIARGLLQPSPKEPR